MPEGEIWAVAECVDGVLDRSTFEVLSKARELADSQETSMTAILMGYGVAGLAQELANKGPDRVLVADFPDFTDYNPDVHSHVLFNAVKEFQPQLVLMTHSYIGMELGPSVATRLEATIACNCLDVNIEDEEVSVTRPMYNDKLRAEILLKKSEPIFVTLQKGALPVKSLPRRGDTITNLAYRLTEVEIRTKVLRTISGEAAAVDITNADVIVAGGRGLETKENFKLVEELARVLGGAVACSRPLVDLGWLPSSYQVGLSGKTVRPKLYIAIGISGASQHMIGMKDAGVIVAINKDPKAPIFEIANYGIVGDLVKIVPILTEQIKGLKKH